MQFSIACETIVRLSNIIKNSELPKCIHVEIVENYLLAIVTNRKIAAFEYLGDAVAGETGSVNIIVDDAMIAQCKIEMMMNGTVQFVVNEMLKFASAKTTLGMSVAGPVVDWGKSEAFDAWRDWAIFKPVTQSRGAMFFHCDQISNLGASSPTGRIAFPEFIDASKPVIVRDVTDERWIGMFMPNVAKPDGNITEAEPAKLPEWVR